MDPAARPSAPARELGLLDCVCLVAGVIIGAGIYKSAPTVAASVPHWSGVLVLWAAGGALSLAGALCYAELAAAYPREGGEYVYLGRAYGPRAGFLFAWAQLVIVRPGLIAGLAFAFADYAATLWAPFAAARVTWAVLAVVALTAVNVAGVRAGARTQNVLTATKVLGLLAVCAVAFVASAAAESPSLPAGDASGGDIGVALIFVLFGLGGWNEVASVAAEVREPARNIARALVLGIALVTALYVLVNAAFLGALGHAGMASSEAVAVDAVAAVLPTIGGKAIAVLVCVSALGAVNGLIFAGARVTWALGAEHRMFAALGSWSADRGGPIRALGVQALLATAVIAVAGSFNESVLVVTPVAWAFFLATVLAVPILRWREPGTPRPFRVPLWPLTVAVFSAISVFLIYSSFRYAAENKQIGPLAAAAALLLGLVLSAFSRGRARERRGS